MTFKKLIPLFFAFFICLFSVVPYSTKALTDEEQQDMYNTIIDTWNYVNNGIQSGADANAQNAQNKKDMDELKDKVDEMDPEKAIKDYFDTIKDDETEDPSAATEEDIDKKYKLPTGGTSKKVLAGPRAMANMADYFLEAAINMIMWADPASSEYIDQKTNGVLSDQLGSYSINLSNIGDSNTTLGKLVNPIRIFAYSLVLLFFAVNLVEQTIKYEIFTVKGILQIFGRLLLAKIIIDLSVRICLLIIAIISVKSNAR